MSEVIQRTIQEVHEVAANMGLECVLPDSDELFLDLDHTRNSMMKVPGTA